MARAKLKMPEPDYNEMDRAADEAARARQEDKLSAEQREHKRVAGALLTLLPKRDQEVLAWVCEVSNKTPGQVATEMIRQALVRERRAYREAHGGGGASSQDPEALAARLPRR